MCQRYDMFRYFFFFFFDENVIKYFDGIKKIKSFTIIQSFHRSIKIER